jgi:hypothetical protein
MTGGSPARPTPLLSESTIEDGTGALAEVPLPCLLGEQSNLAPHDLKVIFQRRHTRHELRGQ